MAQDMIQKEAKECRALSEVTHNTCADGVLYDPPLLDGAELPSM